jgi:hypothetical protein
MTNGTRATIPLTPRRDSGGMGKFVPSPTRIAIASHDAKNAPTMNGVIIFGEGEVRCVTIAGIAVWAATMKIDSAMMIKAVLKLRREGKETSSGCIIIIQATFVFLDI